MGEALHRRLCPVCRRELGPEVGRQFCSERCRVIDLSRWLNEEYRIRGESDGEEGGDGTVVHAPGSSEAPDDPE